MKNDSLGDRMKAYENAYRHYLPRRLPVIIRVDGRAFHTFTRGFRRPFDEALMRAMQHTALKLCEEIAGCKLAYVQSDEISLLLTNNDTIETQPWFDNNLQKLVSLSASIATTAFSKAFADAKWAWYTQRLVETEDENGNPHLTEEDRRLDEAYMKQKTANFDARAFVLPEDEVCNYFIWRQQDAIRNSIQMVAQSLYSHKELQNKNQADLQEMIKAKDVDWNDYPVPCKRGSCVVRHPVEVNGAIRNKWSIDKNIPVFHKNRSYVESSFMHKE